VLYLMILILLIRIGIPIIKHKYLAEIYFYILSFLCMNLNNNIGIIIMLKYSIGAFTLLIHWLIYVSDRQRAPLVICPPRFPPPKRDRFWIPSCKFQTYFSSQIHYTVEYIKLLNIYLDKNIICIFLIQSSKWRAND